LKGKKERALKQPTEKGHPGDGGEKTRPRKTVYPRGGYGGIRMRGNGEDIICGNSVKGPS